MHKNRLIFLLISISLVFGSDKFQNIPEYQLTLEQRVIKHGYPIEVHQIITEDGYILVAYRIPHGLKNIEPDNKNKSAILILHGMFGSPHNFIVLGKKKSAPYYFADRGMDVWLFSARGGYTPFKRKHVKLDWNKDSEYWMHSLHELGTLDAAATIDYILKCTGQEKVTLIGHSAGGHESFMLLSDRPEYNQKVKLVIAWGSVPLMNRLDYPVILLGVHLGTRIAKGLLKYIKMTEYFPTVIPSLRPLLIEKYLKKDPLWYDFLRLMTHSIGSHISVMAPEENNCVILSNVPRLSTMLPMHFMGNLYNGTFQKYDYGPGGNLKRYGQTDPPHYNLSAVSAPVAFFRAEHDGFVTLEDIYSSMEKLPNTVFLHKVLFYRFTHTDYIFGINATELIYEPTLQMIRKIDSGFVPPRIEVPSDFNKGYWN